MKGATTVAVGKDAQVALVRSFNRLVTRRVGALEDDYLERGRPLAEARLIFEIGHGGADVSVLRNRLGLDSGYLSRLLQSLKTQGLVEVRRRDSDGRLRRVSLTPEGLVEHAAYDRLSDRLAESWLDPLTSNERDRLVAAMAEVERLLRAASVKIQFESAAAAEARACWTAYVAELAERFEGGFAPDTSPPDDLGPPGGAFVMARLDGSPVGIGALKALDKSTGEIKRVWTSPSARGLGVARRILRKLEDAARELGFSRVRLDTNRSLTEARALYLKEGYSEIARYSDNPYAHHWFEKTL